MTNIKYPISNIQYLGQQGYIALSTVLVVLVVVMAITLTSTYTALNEAQSGLSLFQGDENLAGAEGCAEEAMLKIRLNPVAVTSISRPEGTCTITYALSGPVNWDMTVTFASTTTTNYSRSIKVVFSRSTSALTLTSWREI